jgi:hypothetical protein
MNHGLCFVHAALRLRGIGCTGKSGNEFKTRNQAALAYLLRTHCLYVSLQIPSIIVLVIFQLPLSRVYTIIYYLIYEVMTFPSISGAAVSLATKTVKNLYVS